MKEDDVKEWLECGAIIQLDDRRLLIGWGERIWLENYDEKAHASYYFPDFFLKSKQPWFIHKNNAIVSIQELKLPLDNANDLIPQYTLIEWIGTDEAKFRQAFENLQHQFASKQLLKAVPYSVEQAHFAFETGRLARSLVSILNYIGERSAYIYGFWEHTSSIIRKGMLGVTPEVLFTTATHGDIVTMACAGTKPPDVTEAAFLSNHKELSEHKYVVDDIVDSLKQFGTVEIAEKKLLSFSNLAHLVTPIKLRRLPKDHKLTFEALVKAIHPTSALGAYPKCHGEKWLADYACLIQRERFGAPAGYYLSPARSASFGAYVAIRNAQWSGNEVRVIAGCGVVKDSVYANEWNEIQLKLKSIKDILAL